MSTILAWLGAAGGAAIFITGIWSVVRAVIRLADTTNDNTQAIKDLTGKISKMGDQVAANSVAIARLQGRRGRG